MTAGAGTLAIVVPCFNEEAVLPETAARLADLVEDLSARGVVAAGSHVCFVDDGSTDRTWALIEEQAAAGPRVRGIKLSRNHGHQNALLAGLLTVDADVVVTIDADLQDDITVMERMIEAHAGGADIVFGVRGNRDSDSMGKRVLAEGFYRLLRGMGVNVVFNHADYRLMSRRALAALKEFGEVNLFLRGVIPTIGFPTAVVTYDRQARAAGESKYPLRRMLALAINGITSFSAVPLRMIALLGVAIFLFTLLLSVRSSPAGRRPSCRCTSSAACSFSASGSSASTSRRSTWRRSGARGSSSRRPCDGVRRAYGAGNAFSRSRAETMPMTCSTSSVTITRCTPASAMRHATTGIESSGRTVIGSFDMNSSTTPRPSTSISVSMSSSSSSESVSKNDRSARQEALMQWWSKSVRETTPTTRPWPSMTGAPEISSTSRTRESSRTVVSGVRQMGSVVITSAMHVGVFVRVLMVPLPVMPVFGTAASPGAASRIPYRRSSPIAASRSSPPLPNGVDSRDGNGP
jgi:glycosyltransferase involved in cell wall biosynthesis